MTFHLKNKKKIHQIRKAWSDFYIRQEPLPLIAIRKWSIKKSYDFAEIIVIIFWEQIKHVLEILWKWLVRSGFKQS